MLQETDLYCDDGLALPEIGIWAKQKHQKIAYYAGLFATSMKNKWDNRIYLDLYSCAGKGIIKEKRSVVPGSPLLSLNVSDPFDSYIFVEKNHENFCALKKRCERYFPERNCSFIEGDCNQRLMEILREIPSFNKHSTGLTFCFVDPYKTRDLVFSTIRKLSENLIIDFLILIPSFMDINRNAGVYTLSDNKIIDNFLGDANWRESWNNYPNRRYDKFGNFIADNFGQRMKRMGYLYEGMNDMQLVRMGTGKNLPLYHLAFFSKNPVGLKLWCETIRRTNIQGELNFNLGV